MAMELSDFLRTYQLRAPQIMWFLGAGGSVAARVPSAYDMIWDFKRWLFCSAQRVSLRACDDLSNPILRAKIQRYCDTLPDAPAADADEEYSYYFEQAFPSEADRRKYIDKNVAGAKRSQY